MQLGSPNLPALFDRIKSARPSPVQLNPVELALLEAHLATYRPPPQSLRRLQQEKMRGMTTYQDEIKANNDWIAHLKMVVDFHHRTQKLAPSMETIAPSVPDESAVEVKHKEATTHPSGCEGTPTSADPQQFARGEVVFHADRVEICGAVICTGLRSRSRRIVLELLSRRTPGGSFAAYSGDVMEEQVKAHGGKGEAAGLIRDLRDEIMGSLRSQANIISGNKDVILSGGPGYRFADCLSVRFADPPTITDITDTAEESDVRDDDVRDVSNVLDDESERRRAWILQQLENGVQLKAPMVAAHFRRSKKTAQRDLDALRDEGLIKFVGNTRTGYYRLVGVRGADR